MKLIFNIIALTTLTGCAINRPICQPEDPAYIKEMHSCRAAAPEVRLLLLDGYDFRRCRDEAAAKGLYPRNIEACLDPTLHAEVIQEKQRIQAQGSSR